MQEAYEGEEDAAERLRAGLAAFLDFLAREPAFARMCIVEALAAGSEAVQRRNAAMATFARIIDKNARASSPPLDPPALTAETVVGGIYEVIYTRVVRATSATCPTCCRTSCGPPFCPMPGPRPRWPSTSGFSRRPRPADALPAPARVGNGVKNALVFITRTGNAARFMGEARRGRRRTGAVPSWR